MYSNFKFNFFAILCLGFFMSMTSCTPEQQESIGDKLSRIHSWELKLDEFKAPMVDEDGWASDGDEPYFIVIKYQSKFNTEGSTRTSILKFDNEDWANGIDDFDPENPVIVNIPEDMGTMRFNTVLTCKIDSVLAFREMPEILGAVVLSMESDATPFGIMGDLAEDVRVALHEQLESLIEDAELNILNETAMMSQINTALQEVQGSVVPSVGEAIGIFLASFADPDQFVNAHFFGFAAVEENDFINFPPSNDLFNMKFIGNHRFDLDDNPINFRDADNTIHYQISAEMRRL